MYVFLFFHQHYCFFLGYYVSYGKDKGTAAFSYIFTFFILVFISSVRYGIGTDYPHYEFYYYAIENGAKIYKYTEPVFYWLIRGTLYFKLSFQYFIVVTSLLTTLFFFLSVSKKTFFFEILLYYGLIYLQAFCLIRQMLACTISIFAFKKYGDSKIKCAFLLIFSSLVHRTFWILLLVYFLSFIINIKDSKTTLIIITAFVLIYLTPVIDIVVTKILTMTKLESGDYFVLMHRIGPVVALRYLLMFFYLYLIKKFANTKLNKLLMITLFVIEFSGTRILILASRLPQTLYSVFFFAVQCFK